MAFDAHKNRTICLAWAAGLFEGEGCIVADYYNRNGNPRVQLVLGSTDIDVLERFQVIMGCGTITERKMNSDKHKRFFVWGLYGKNTLPVLLDLLPYLGERRSIKARQALELIKSIQLSNKEKSAIRKELESVV